MVAYTIKLFQINKDTCTTHGAGQIIVTHHPSSQAAGMKDVCAICADNASSVNGVIGRNQLGRVRWNPGLILHGTKANGTIFRVSLEQLTVSLAPMDPTISRDDINSRPGAAFLGVGLKEGNALDVGTAPTITSPRPFW